MIGGYRITHANEVENHSPHSMGRKHEMTRFNLKMLELIPLYPRCIRVADLAVAMKTTRRSVEARLTTCEGHALICQEGQNLSRVEA